MALTLCFQSTSAVIFWLKVLLALTALGIDAAFHSASARLSPQASEAEASLLQAPLENSDNSEFDIDYLGQGAELQGRLMLGTHSFQYSIRDNAFSYIGGNVETPETSTGDILVPTYEDGNKITIDVAGTSWRTAIAKRPIIESFSFTSDASNNWFLDIVGNCTENAQKGIVCHPSCTAQSSAASTKCLYFEEGNRLGSSVYKRNETLTISRLGTPAQSVPTPAPTSTTQRPTPPPVSTISPPANPGSSISPTSPSTPSGATVTTPSPPVSVLSSAVDVGPRGAFSGNLALLAPTVALLGWNFW